MPATKIKENTFILVWDNLGLETILPVSDIRAECERAAKEHVWDILKDTTGDEIKKSPKEVELNNIMSRLMLRARTNSHRHYEIYMITTAKGIGEEELKNLFEQSPQAASDLIRERGTKLFSNRAKPGTIRIV
jgi:hypothetical protein